jgi:competence CoiA-like predicted nuclease
MLTARAASGEILSSIDASAMTDHANLFCRVCGLSVTFHPSSTGVPHFGHKTPGRCLFDYAENRFSRKAKQSMFEELRGEGALMEQSLGSVVPDILFLDDNDRWVAVEFVTSSTQMIDLEYHVRRYVSRGIPFLLVHAGQKLRENKKTGSCKSLPWAQWLSVIYFGRFYEWVDGADLQPMHLEWKGDGHALNVCPRTVHAFRDFSVKDRKSMETPYGDVPEGAIWMDRLTKWWANDAATGDASVPDATP